MKDGALLPYSKNVRGRASPQPTRNGKTIESAQIKLIGTGEGFRLGPLV